MLVAAAALAVVACSGGDLDDLRAVLGNDVLVAAFRDGAIIARLAWHHVPSKENNRVFGREQSFVAGAPTHVQFMVKDSRRYAGTGGWTTRSSTTASPPTQPCTAAPGLRFVASGSTDAAT